MIYHILPQAAYQARNVTEVYRAASLETEGFIHCTGHPDLLVWVANRFYRATSGNFVVLCIAENRLQAEVRWEESDGNLFPHIYGPLDWGAVERVIDFPRKPDGTFLLPPGLV